jgi:large conductance mechanosensitive channel
LKSFLPVKSFSYFHISLIKTNTMGFVKEFKEFALKGNVIDLAVGVIIGGAFGKIIDSVVNDLIMPIVSAIIGSPDFSSLYLVLKGNVPEGTALAEARKVPQAVILAYGNFITVFINFLLLALIIFLMIKAINRLKRKQAEVPAAPPSPSSTDQLLVEIRDELKKRPQVQ